MAPISHLFRVGGQGRSLRDLLILPTGIAVASAQQARAEPFSMAGNASPDLRVWEVVRTRIGVCDCRFQLSIETTTWRLYSPSIGSPA